MFQVLSHLLHRLLGLPDGASRYCEECGRRTEDARRCEQCAAMAQRIAEQPTQPTQPVLTAVMPGEVVDITALVTALADVEPVPDSSDDEPFPFADAPAPAGPSTAPLALLIPSLGDEFSEQVVWLRLAHETLPPVRDDWSSRCPWCAREMRELCDDTYTHRPTRATLATCERHHAGQLALLRDLHSGGYRTRFDADTEKGA